MANYDDIVGWITVKGRRVPIRKGKGNAKGEFGNTGVVGFTTKKRGDKLKRPVNISKKNYESSVQKAKEQKAKALEERRLDKTSVMNQAYTRRERAKNEKSKKDPITEKNGKFYLKSPVNGTQRIFKTKEAAQNYLRNADVIDSHARGLGRSAEYAGPHTKKKK